MASGYTSHISPLPSARKPASFPSPSAASSSRWAASTRKTSAKPSCCAISAAPSRHTSEAGFHFKAPWQDAIGWDIRNRQINFFKDSAYAYDGGSYEGAEVSINDASGTKANIDVQVIYSIDADKVEDLYAEYGTQEAFVTNYVSNDLRATAREVAANTKR